MRNSMIATKARIAALHNGQRAIQYSGVSMAAAVSDTVVKKEDIRKAP